MDEGTKYRVPIGDACVSMRVCFDSLCFSSTQQRLDEEDADAVVAVVATTSTTTSSSAAQQQQQQLPTTVVAAIAAFTVPHAVGVAAASLPVASMSSLREVQELLRAKEERILELETVLCRRDAEIQELRSHLDKFLSVLGKVSRNHLTSLFLQRGSFGFLQGEKQ